MGGTTKGQLELNHLPSLSPFADFRFLPGSALLRGLGFLDRFLALFVLVAMILGVV